MNVALIAVAVVLLVLIVSVFLLRMYVLRRKKGKTPSEKSVVTPKSKVTSKSPSQGVSGGSPAINGGNRRMKSSNRPVSMSLGQLSADGPSTSRRQVQQNLLQMQERERARQSELERMRELDRQQQDDERERRGNGSDGGSDHERDRRPRRRADDANDEEQRPRRDNPRTTLRRHRPDSTVIDLASLQANSSPNPRPPASAATSANPAAVANYSMGGYMQYPGMYGAGIFPGQMPIVGPTQPKNRSANQREESSDPNVSSTQMTTPQFAHMPGYPMNMPYFHPAMWMAAQQNMSPMPPIPAAFKQNGSTSQPTDMPTAASMPVSPTLNSDSHRQPHGRSSADNSRRRRMHESIRPDQDISSDFRPDSYFPPELADTSRRRDDTSDDLPPSYQFVADQQLRNAAR